MAFVNSKEKETKKDTKIGLVSVNELRCLSCICAGCPHEYNCEDKPCDDSTNPYQCVLVQFSCEKYDMICEKK